MYLKSSIQSILKNRFFSIITLIQLFIAFFVLTIAMVLIGDSLNTIISFGKIFDEERTIYVSQTTNMIQREVTEDEMNNILDFYKDLNSDSNIEKMGICSIAPYNIENIGYLDEISKGEMDGTANCLYLDKNFINYIDKYDVVEGRKLESQDFEKSSNDKTPILVSNDLRQYLPLGSIYKNCEVVGILDEDSKLYYNTNGFLYAGAIQKDNTIIYPVDYKDTELKRDISYGFLEGTMITLKDKKLVDEYIDKITSRMEEIYMVPMKVNRVADYKDEYIDSIKTGITITSAFAALLIIFSFWGVMGIVLSCLIRRKKEFGIKLSLGWTIKDVCIQVLIEMFILCINAFVLAVLASFIVVHISKFSINIKLYLCELVVVFILSIIYSIIPVYRVKKMNIVNLVKDVR